MPNTANMQSFATSSYNLSEKVGVTTVSKSRRRFWHRRALSDTFGGFPPRLEPQKTTRLLYTRCSPQVGRLLGGTFAPPESFAGWNNDLGWSTAASWAYRWSRWKARFPLRGLQYIVRALSEARHSVFVRPSSMEFQSMEDWVKHRVSTHACLRKIRSTERIP